uniref:Peptidase M23 n=1 Tax=Parastrongyloides trichosuri TaxID=131310 RepID=A0A0N4ZYZ8_PARTI
MAYQRYPVYQLLKGTIIFNETMEQQKNEIIWSRESKYHSEYGKISRIFKNNTYFEREQSPLSRYVSFLILGSVIIFIVVLVAHHFATIPTIRKIDKRKDDIVKKMETSYALMSQSYGFDNEMGMPHFGRVKKKSLTDIFRQFRL